MVCFRSCGRNLKTHYERRVVGFEVELIGSHTSDLRYVDPSCSTRCHVRSALEKACHTASSSSTFRFRLAIHMLFTVLMAIIKSHLTSPRDGGLRARHLPHLTCALVVKA